MEFVKRIEPEKQARRLLFDLRGDGGGGVE